MRELVVISGKGGTGKTSVVAALTRLAGRAAVADCDVDAPDLHLVLGPTVERREEFSGGSAARVDAHRCTGCGACLEICRFDAIAHEASSPVGVALDRGAHGRVALQPVTTPVAIDSRACEGCGLCARVCPEEAVTIEPVVNGEWYVSRTFAGPMVHARLGVAEENSGKLVTLVRRAARDAAAAEGLDLLIVDGPPGIGCPVIASLSGADLALIVTEPTVSGRHDLERVTEVARHFRVPVAVCVNRFDINPEVGDDIERAALEQGALFTARVRYDAAVTAAQVAATDAVGYGATAGADLETLWDLLSAHLTKGTAS